MSTETVDASTDGRRLSTRRLVVTGIVMTVGYWTVARGSIGGSTGGIASDGSWVDARGQATSQAPLDYAIDLGPSPLVVLIVLAALVVAWSTSEVRGRLAWLAPACEVVAVAVPIAAIVGTFLWVPAFGMDWQGGVPITPPWWSVSTVTIDRLE